MTDAELAKRKAEWAEQKAQENTGVNAKNVRVYQNLDAKFWRQHYSLISTPSDGI